MPIALGTIALFRVNAFVAMGATGCFHKKQKFLSVASVARVQKFEVGINSVDNARKACRRDAPSVLIEDIELVPQCACDIQQALLSRRPVNLLRSVKHSFPLFLGEAVNQRPANES